jgi:hypothetical protein
VLPCFSAHRFLLRGASFILNRFRCQAAVATSLFRFTSSSALLPGFSFEGRRNLLPFRFLCQLASLTRFFPPAVFCRLRDGSGSAGGGFYHRRVSSQLRFVDCLFRSVCCSRPEVPTASAVSPSRPRGRGMYRLAPPRVNRSFNRAAVLARRPPFKAKWRVLLLPVSVICVTFRREVRGLIHQAIGRRKLFSPGLFGRPRANLYGPQGPERSNRSLERSTRPCRQRSATTTAWRSPYARSKLSFTMM